MRSLTREQRRARLEDLQWMADTGETLTGACARLNVSKEALDKWCRTNRCGDLYQRLAAREPGVPTHNGATPAERILNPTRRRAA